MRAGGDVDEILFAIGIKSVLGGEIEKRGINLFEIPRVFNDYRAGTHLGVGGNQHNIFRPLLSHAEISRLM